MRFLAITILLLTSCASVEATAERRLNEYAAVATNAEQLANHLTGAALESAIQTIEFLSQSDLSSKGSVRFSATTSLDADLVRSCLDVSGTSFFDSTGAPVIVERIPRQVVEVQFEQLLISDLRLTGEPC